MLSLSQKKRETAMANPHFSYNIFSVPLMSYKLANNVKEFYKLEGKMILNCSLLRITCDLRPITQWNTFWHGLDINGTHTKNWFSMDKFYCVNDMSSSMLSQNFPCAWTH